LRKPTRPSFVRISAGNELNPEAAGSMELGPKLVKAVRVPPRCSSPVDWTATYTPSGVRAIPRGGLSSVIVCTISPFEGSSRVSEPSFPFVTHTSSESAATLSGPRPTCTRSFTELVRGSIIEAVPSARFVTQTAPAPDASALGSPPTPISLSTRPERGSRTATLAVGGDAIQIRPNPAAIPDAPTAAGRCLVTLLIPGAIRDTVPSAELVTHSAPSP
jgi:hypothetical protein